MAHKKFGGWLVNGKLFAQIKVANELWYNTSAKGERITHLFRLGYDEIEEYKPHRLYSLVILWISIQVGY